MKTILVVEDEPGIREALVEILQRENYSVQTARHGQDALDLLNSTKALPHLIVLDMYMPVMDGRTFLGHIALNPKLSKIPILIVSGSEEMVIDLPKTCKHCRKPFPIQTLLHAVTDLLTN